MAVLKYKKTDGTWGKVGAPIQDITLGSLGAQEKLVGEQGQVVGFDQNGDAIAIDYQGGVTSVNGQTGDVVVNAPTKTSELENDSGFATSSQITENTSEMLGRTTAVNIADTNYTTYMARGEALYPATQAETVSPAVNGAIVWFYE